MLLEGEEKGRKAVAMAREDGEKGMEGSSCERSGRGKAQRVLMALKLFLCPGHAPRLPCPRYDTGNRSTA